jgi:hypothetical protein
MSRSRRVKILSLSGDRLLDILRGDTTIAPGCFPKDAECVGIQVDPINHHLTLALWHESFDVVEGYMS